MDKITFSGTISRKICFAMQQNYIPVIRDLTIKNNTSEPMNGVRVRITFEPEFAKPFEPEPLDLARGTTARIDTVNIILSAEKLFELTEKMVSVMSIQAFIGDELIGEYNTNVEMLAYDQWTGTEYIPELIAAFVTPNHPAISEIVSEASVYLRKWCGDPSFSGYQRKSANAVKMQTAAIYAALQARSIAYISPPASYETAQRIRLPENVISGSSGTCIDLAVLFCACLEHVDLNPVLIVTKGHAFAGCWLEEETFSDCLEYDASAITKRIAKGVETMCAFECTDIVLGRSVDFDSAEAHAAERLRSDDDFQFAVDIRRTRAGGIRPIPSRVTENGAYKAVDYGTRDRREITDAPSEIIRNGAADNVQGELTRRQMWERKLLDLDMRNSLLNFRTTSSAVQLMTADLSMLADELSSGSEYRVCAMPNDDILKASDSNIFEIENNISQIDSIARAELKNHRLRTFLNEVELDRAMTKLRRLARLSLEENGANTIYAALGFLKWYETDRSEKPRIAPLVLIPIDISRRIQDKSFSIKIREEGAQVNVTLIEMLRRSYGIEIYGLDQISEDGKIADLQQIFNTFRQAVMAQSRWDVKEYSFIGRFSFSRFIMWNDIRSRSYELTKNKITASLISGRTVWDGGDISITPSELDSTVMPSDMAVPVSADSSQLAAVYAAHQGKSFVLHGPPGTGKSQTITNIIADALFSGKTVLFVAEKMAALEVVQKRLGKLGLTPFLIELHSNKARKRDLLKQLEETLELGRVKSPEEYASESEKNARLRAELNSVMEELHRVRECGMSVYDAAVRYEQFSEYGGKLVFNHGQVSAVNGEVLGQWRSELENLAAAGKSFGDVKNTALKACKLTECAPDTRLQLEQLLADLRSALAKCDRALDTVKKLLGKPDCSHSEFDTVARLVRETMSNGVLIPSIISGGSWEREKPDVMQMISAGREMQTLFADISAHFNGSVFSYDYGTAFRNWNEANGKWFVGKFFGTRKLVKELDAMALTRGTVTAENIETYYRKLMRFGDLSRWYAQIPSAVHATYSACGMKADALASDWNCVELSVMLSERLRGILSASAIEIGMRDRLANSLASAFGDENRRSGNRNLSDQLIKAHTELESCLTALENDFAVKFGSMDSLDWTASASREAERMTAELPQLREWTGINAICRRLEELGIGNVAEKFLSGDVSSRDLLPAFDCDLSRSLVSHMISQSVVLSRFQGVLFEETIRKFGVSLDTFRNLTIKELVAKLSARIPAHGDAAASSETGILQKAIRSGGRGISIRKLFESIPDLLMRICPVMLMSPISAAQYLPSDFPKFDYVIFDEASQLPTCEAVGAISRGENIIIVGDPKQLPPTSFFSANHFDEENSDKEDLESLLDDCLALSMPQEHLLWHYRSRHESLIAYSNAKYYDNRLYTFPSPDDRISEVSWVHVDGVYDKSTTRTNRAEAQAVVHEIIRRLESPTLRKQSIGVVTFSMPQQNLIDDLLTEAYRKRPELEAMAGEQYEPIIIKNLENVQGDERDVIMFSIGYGPDREGRVSMNFGPLNRDGGWRRLNVAISRARCSMIVFSVITPDMIDLSRTRSEGVAGLKGFLEFADKGKSVLSVRADRAAETDGGFERVIADELGKRGYTVECSVGCSDFRIDAAVCNPDDPDRYILGIFCGTKSAYLHGTAQDRHISQGAVLRGLGWNTVNVHILDWLDNKEKVLSVIESKIAEALAEYRRPKVEEPAPEEENIAPEEPEFEKEEPHSLLESCASYIPYEVKTYGTSESFTERNAEDIAGCIMNILRTEAPVSRSVLIKKLAACYGIQRITANVKSIADRALTISGVVITAAGEESFVWLPEQDPASYKKCRAVCPDGVKRPMDEIAPQEIAEAVKLIISEQGSMAREDIVRETAHLFGYTRVSPTVESAVSLGLQEANIRGYIEFSENGRIKSH